MTVQSQPDPRWDPIIHLDLKPHNVFGSSKLYLNDSSWPRIVLGDFGCAVFKSDITKGKVSGPVPGTPGWFSPECNAGGHARVSPASDIWQLAGICQALAKFVSRPNLGMGGYPLGGHYSWALNDCVARMSRFVPQHRPSALQILAILEQWQIFV